MAEWASRRVLGVILIFPPFLKAQARNGKIKNSPQTAIVRKLEMAYICNGLNFGSAVGAVSIHLSSTLSKIRIAGRFSTK